MNFSSCSDHSWIINDCYIFFPYLWVWIFLFLRTSFFTAQNVGPMVQKELATVRERWRSEKGGCWAKSWDLWTQRPGHPTREDKSAFLVAVWKFCSSTRDIHRIPEKCSNISLLTLRSHTSSYLFVLLSSTVVYICCVCCVFVKYVKWPWPEMKKTSRLLNWPWAGLRSWDSGDRPCGYIVSVRTND